MLYNSFWLLNYNLLYTQSAQIWVGIRETIKHIIWLIHSQLTDLRIDSIADTQNLAKNWQFPIDLISL